jgi:hypothetical protein
MNTLDYIKRKFKLRYKVSMPITLPFNRRKGFISLMNELGFKTGAEIGVLKGKYSERLLRGIDGLKLFCIDPWEVYDNYIECHNKEAQTLYDSFFEETKERLKGKNVEIIRKFSLDAVKDFKDNSLDFVFIDGNHSFRPVIDDIEEWEKKVRKGGIISGHDYWNSIEQDKLYKLYEPTTPIERLKLCQVKDAIKAWTATNKISPWFITTGDKCNSWLYVK